MTYSSFDLKFCSYLCLKGYKVTDILKSKEKKNIKEKVKFVFEIPSEDIIKSLGIEFQNSEISTYMRVLEGLRNMMLDYDIKM